jgi:hypothetical protein
VYENAVFMLIHKANPGATSNQILMGTFYCCQVVSELACVAHIITC